MSVNKAMLVGHLCADPESRSFPNGGSACNLRIATNRRWKDKKTGEQKEAVEYHRVTFSGKLAEICQQYLHKGSQVYIEGRIQTRKWQDQSGQDRYSTEIVANEMRMLDSKGASRQSENMQRNAAHYSDDFVATYKPYAQQAPSNAGGGIDPNSEIPF